MLRCAAQPALATADAIRAALEAEAQAIADEDVQINRQLGALGQEVVRDGIPYTLIADKAAGQLMRTGRVDLVLYGADRVAANGDVAKNVGSYKLAVVAKENGIPCFCVSPTSTIDMSLPSGDDIPIEERAPEEVTVVNGRRIAPDGVPVANIAFDVTPHRYLSGIITEYGTGYLSTAYHRPYGICPPPPHPCLLLFRSRPREGWPAYA